MERLSTHQFMILGSAVLLGTTFFPAGAMLAQIAGRDGWMSIFPGFALAIPFGLMVLSMIPKYPNKNLIEISEKVLGKWIGKGFGILYITIVTYFGALLAAQGVDMFVRSILPVMPRYVFIIGGMLIISFLFLNGIEVLARFAEVVFPIVSVALVLIALFSIPRFEQGELYPILANGIMPVLNGALKVAPWSMEYVLVLVGLIPFLPKQPKDLKKLKKEVWRTVFFIAFLNTILVLVQILTFGPFEAARINYGILVLGKMIEVSRTLSGVESVFALVWMGALIIKVGAIFFAGMWGLQGVFGVKKKTWSIGLIIIYILIPMLYKRGPDILMEIGLINDYLILPFTMFWVLLIWGVEKWKKRSKKV